MPAPIIMMIMLVPRSLRLLTSIQGLYAESRVTEEAEPARDLGSTESIAVKGVLNR